MSIRLTSQAFRPVAVGLFMFRTARRVKAAGERKQCAHTRTGGEHKAQGSARTQGKAVTKLIRSVLSPDRNLRLEQLAGSDRDLRGHRAQGVSSPHEGSGNTGHRRCRTGSGATTCSTTNHRHQPQASTTGINHRHQPKASTTGINQRRQPKASTKGITLWRNGSGSARKGIVSPSPPSPAAASARASSTGPSGRRPARRPGC